ncbi:hypothetical protein [Halalkalicoccus sp. NIPERK01]|nr:hypothetical protein [Halalkalicoccus sp. NIPERK01]MDL5361324.1 hypothetical protein [Halalkalicoccus sp. NIPERK01]
MVDTKHARLPETVYNQAEAIQEEYGYPSIGEAIRHMCKEAGYDV